MRGISKFFTFFDLLDLLRFFFLFLFAWFLLSPFTLLLSNICSCNNWCCNKYILSLYLSLFLYFRLFFDFRFLFFLLRRLLFKAKNRSLFLFFFRLLWNILINFCPSLPSSACIFRFFIRFILSSCSV